MSVGPVAAGGWAEAVENILRRGFVGGRAQAPAAGLCHSRAPGKAVEGHRSPRRWRVHGDARLARSVLECASPMALWAVAWWNGGRAQAPSELMNLGNGFPG